MNDDAKREERHARERYCMVEDISAASRNIRELAGKPISKRVLDVMGKVPRHRFISEEQGYVAYGNYPLPIGHGQTISQPFIVALMTDLLAPGEHDRVLEIGTGSGYQTAVLAELAGQVYSVEVVEPLAERAAQLLKALGYANVETRAGNGRLGWPEHAPFDHILVTAAAPHVPQPLLDQLKPGGRMAIPIGEWGEIQNLLLIEKQADGELREHNILPVRFVPFVRGV
jgi:protein-L-isoaspartate(D-aspartate) O-methyltransferase